MSDPRDFVVAGHTVEAEPDAAIVVKAAAVPLAAAAPSTSPQVLFNTVIKHAQPEMKGVMSFFGPATMEREDLRPYLESQHVDMQREYSYTDAFKSLSRYAQVCAYFLIFYFLIFLINGPKEMIVPVFVQFFLLFLICFVCANGCHWFQNYSRPDPVPQPLSVTEFRHVIGISAWKVSSIGCFVFCLAYHVLKDCFEENEYWYHNTLLYIWTTVSAVTVISLSWWFLNRFTKVHVSFSFVMTMFWSGATFVIFFASIFNVLMITQVWAKQNQHCNIGMVLFGTGVPPGTPECVRSQWFQWVFTAGLVEESLKFAVLMRVRTTLQDITSSCWLTRCPRSSETPVPCCSWLLKLATSPAAILLAGVASGGGFATIENVEYVTKILAGYDNNPWMPLIRVLPAGFHMMWTGIVASVYAYEQFFAPKYGFLKYIALFTSMMLHGSWNCFSVFVGLAANGVDGYEGWSAAHLCMVVALTFGIFTLGVISVVKMERRMNAMDVQQSRDVELATSVS